MKDWRVVTWSDNSLGKLRRTLESAIKEDGSIDPDELGVEGPKDLMHFMELAGGKVVPLDYVVSGEWQKD
ncbi:unnamed protein product [Vitrella brassicaformis CCMP3155]|uniref:Uncharacterized protein n=1 Tax=Vitrella brassicaformis (strain CCMP3155) TaxID=1169540 RepID=A0A0G4GFM4_VITBC|nr:unnamed protein product [Vitrella brassicaformis CCMP3155]|eukprot:CEM28310.1 unnamed protein product [Vitrella brassicaformis CCMP3155]